MDPISALWPDRISSSALSHDRHVLLTAALACGVQHSERTRVCSGGNQDPVASVSLVEKLCNCQAARVLRYSIKRRWTEVAAITPSWLPE
jgi:hypothetical protein